MLRYMIKNIYIIRTYVGERQTHVKSKLPDTTIPSARVHYVVNSIITILAILKVACTKV